MTGTAGIVAAESTSHFVAVVYKPAGNPRISAMPRRFFITELPGAGSFRLEGAEVHHLLDVLRIGIGETVILFNGKGIEAPAEVTNVTNGAVELAVRELRPAGN